MAVQLSKESAVQRPQWVGREPDADGDVASATGHAEPHADTPTASPVALSRLLAPSPRDPNAQRAPSATAAPAAPRSTIPERPLTGSPGRAARLEAPRAAASSDAAALAQVTTAMHQRFAAQARDPKAFSELLHQAFGDKFDAAKAETIRQQVLAGDFSWAPKVQVVSSQALADLSGTQAAGSAQGAYVQSSDTIYLSRELLHSDPAQAERILMEEMGHGIDARINTSDAAGDEGEIFSKLMHGDKISAPEMAALKADNDHGVVNINGRNVTVEYGWLSKAFKAVTGGISKVVSSVAKGAVNLAKSAVTVATGLATGDFHKVKEGFKQGISAIKTTVMAVHHAIVDTAKELHRITKQAFQKLMQSKLFAAVLMVCRFIPIPIVQLVVRVIDVVRAAYMVYQGIKNKSLGAVLGGVASLAGGAANLAGSLGASAATVSTINTVASAASKLSMAYSAAANKDIGAAMGLLGGAVGGQGASPAMNTLASAGAYAQQAVSIGQAVRGHDALAALGGVVGLAAQANGNDSATRQNLGTAQEAVTGLRAVREIGRGNLDAAQSLAMGMSAAQQARQQADAVSARRADESQASQAENNRGLLNAADKDLRAAPAAVDDQRNGSDVDSDNTAARNGGAGPAGTQTLLTVGKGQTLEGIARAQYGENWKAGLAQVAQDNGLKLNQWGSPILLQGQTLVLNDLGNKSDDDLARLSRAGGRIISNNGLGLQAKADLEDRARQAAALKVQEAARFSAGNDTSAAGVCSPDNPLGLSQSQLQSEALAQMGRPTSVLDSLRPATGPVGSAEWFRTASEAELHRNGYQTVKAWDGVSRGSPAEEYLKNSGALAANAGTVEAQLAPVIGPVVALAIGGPVGALTRGGMAAYGGYELGYGGAEIADGRYADGAAHIGMGLLSLEGAGVGPITAYGKVVSLGGDAPRLTYVDPYEALQIVNTPKSLRPSPSSYMAQSMIDDHAALFAEGAARIQPSPPTGVIGRTETWVMPKSVADEAIAKANGDVGKLEQLLGLSQGQLGKTPVRVDIPSPNGLQMSSGREYGANTLWNPGGYTNGGLPEAIINPVKPGDYLVTPIKVKP
jgi:hypothetical protein